MLTGDGNEKFKSEKKTLHLQHIFLCISLPLFCTTSTYVKLPSCRFYEGKVVRSNFFCSLPLILTLLASSIFHFLIAALNFSCFFFRNELRHLSFLFCCCCCCCCFLFCFVFRSSSFSVIGVSVVVAGGNCRTDGHFLASRGYLFFFRMRESFANTHSLLRKVVSY